jgi:hypothetical protein
MRLLRISLLSAACRIGAGAALVAGIFSVPSDAHASVSIAVAYDALVKDADSVGVVTPVETKSVWEEGRIYTYTRVKVDQGVAGELGTGTEGWVRTMGGVVGKIGQLVDGEPVFTTGKPSLVFMRKFKMRGPGEAGVMGPTGTWEVSARAQGQYPIVVDSNIADTTRARRVMRSAAVGVLFPPKTTTTVATTDASGVITPKSTTTANGGVATEAVKIRLASEVLHDRPLDEVAREVAASWKKLHAPAPSDTKK